MTESREIAVQPTWRASPLTLAIATCVAAIFAASVVAIRLTVPPQPGDPDATPRRELGALARPAVWFALLTGAVGFAGFFAVYSYVAPLTTEIALLPASAVPWALVTLGLGMTLGNLLGGWAADRSVMRALFASFAVFAVMLLGLALIQLRALRRKD